MKSSDKIREEIELIRSRSEDGAVNPADVVEFGYWLDNAVLARPVRERNRAIATATFYRVRPSLARDRIADSRPPPAGRPTPEVQAKCSCRNHTLDGDGRASGKRKSQPSSDGWLL